MVLYEKSGNTKRQTDLKELLLRASKKNNCVSGRLSGKENQPRGDRDLELAIMRSKQDTRRKNAIDDEDAELLKVLQWSKKQYEEELLRSSQPIAIDDSSDVESARINKSQQDRDRSQENKIVQEDDDDDFQQTRPPLALKRLSQKANSPVRTKSSSSPLQERQRRLSSSDRKTSPSVPSSQAFLSSSMRDPVTVKQEKQEQEGKEVWEFDLSNFKQEKDTQQQRKETAADDDDDFEFDLSKIKQERKSTQDQENGDVLLDLDLSNIKQESDQIPESVLELDLSSDIHAAESTSNRFSEDEIPSSCESRPKRTLPVIFTPSPSPSPPLIPKRSKLKRNADVLPPSPNSPSNPNDDAAKRQQQSRKGKQRAAPTPQVIDVSSDSDNDHNRLPRKRRLSRDTHTSTFSTDDPCIGSSVRTVQCPLCYKQFPPDKIEQHASNCNDMEDTAMRSSSTPPRLARRLARPEPSIFSPELHTIHSDIEDFDEDDDDDDGGNNGRSSGSTRNVNNLQSCIYCSEWIPACDMDRHVSESHASFVNDDNDDDSDCSVIDLCNPHSDDDGYLSPLEGFVALDEQSASDSLYQRYLDMADREPAVSQLETSTTRGRGRNAGSGRGRGRANSQKSGNWSGRRGKNSKGRWYHINKNRKSKAGK